MRQVGGGGSDLLFTSRNPSTYSGLFLLLVFLLQNVLILLFDQRRQKNKHKSKQVLFVEEKIFSIIATEIF